MTSDKKQDGSELTTDVLIADALLRLTALEKLLISKGLFSKEELSQVTEDLVKQVAKTIIDKAEASKNLDDFIASLSGIKKEMKN
jgi:TPP-dependent pyruvate/acetoin dehydrogenase alpha subunit